MILAIENDNDDAVKYLLGKGADAHIEDHMFNDACDYAKQKQKFSNYPIFNNCEKEYRKKPNV